MKKILSILLSLLCFCSATLLVGCDDGSLSESASSSTDSGSTNTGDDSTGSSTDSGSTDTGEDNTGVEERKVIKITSDVTPFTEETKGSITITNVPQTTTTFDEKNFTVEESYDNQGNLQWIYMTTDKTDNVFAFFDEKCRDFPETRNGVLMLLNSENIENFEVTYAINRKFSTSTQNDLNDTFDITTQLEGYIEMPDGRQYYTTMSFYPDGLMGECNSGSIHGREFSLQYICYDGDAFLTESYFVDPPCGLAMGNYPWRWGEFGVYYQSSDENNPYGENMVPTSVFYYYICLRVNIYDDTSYNPNGNPSLTDEEAELVYGKIYEMIKDSFVVYDYDHYQKQYDEEK